MPREKMWIDCHTQPKRVTTWRHDRAILMIIPEESDVEVELKRTYMLLLPGTDSTSGSALNPVPRDARSHRSCALMDVKNVRQWMGFQLR